MLDPNAPDRPVSATASSSGPARVTVDIDRCVGAGHCVTSAPAIFDQDDEVGTVVLLRVSPDVGEVDAVRAAITLCPAAAIGLTARAGER